MLFFPLLCIILSYKYATIITIHIDIDLDSLNDMLQI